MVTTTGPQLPTPLTAEAREMLKTLVQERDAAAQRLDVAVAAMKAALGVPATWTIRNIDEGFVEPAQSGGDN